MSADATVERHPLHPRLLRVRLGREPLRRFGEALAEDDFARPGAGRACADDLLQLVPALAEALAAVYDRRRGGVVVEPDVDDPRLVTALSAAVAHLCGDVLPEDRRTDGQATAPVDFVRIALAHDPEPPARLRHFADPALPWPLHTDRAPKEEVGDFLVVCKLSEEDAIGGGIRLLHLDDFGRLDEFLDHPLAFAPLTWRHDIGLAPARLQPLLRRSPGVRAAVFGRSPEGPTVRLTDSRFRLPDSAEQADYLERLDEALAEQAGRLAAFDLPVGGLYAVNNRFVLHGREGFADRPGFTRTLLRYCGVRSTAVAFQEAEHATRAVPDAGHPEAHRRGGAVVAGGRGLPGP